MTAAQFRKLALAIAGAVESSHMNHPDFRFAGRIFATLGYPDDDWGMIKLTPGQQRSFMEAAPDVFSPCKGAWGARGATSVLLASAGSKVVQAALEAACENLGATKRKSRRP